MTEQRPSAERDHIAKFREAVTYHKDKARIWLEDAQYLLERYDALTSELAKRTRERDALLGKPDAVHQGALAAIEALKQAVAVSDRIETLERALHRCNEVACATGSHRAAEIVAIVELALSGSPEPAKAQEVTE